MSALQLRAWRELFSNLVKGLKEGNSSLQVVQKLLINCVGERDYSAQETCHLLLQLPMFKSSRDFIVLSLEGSRAVHSQLSEGQDATAPAIVDHYCSRPTTQTFEAMPLLSYAESYSMPRLLGEQPKQRKKKVVVIPRRYCSPDPNGPNMSSTASRNSCFTRVCEVWLIFCQSMTHTQTHMRLS